MSGAWTLLILIGLGTGLSLDPITLQQRPDGHRVFVDSKGREKLFHGTNAVVKGPPWHPDGRNFVSGHSDEMLCWLT